MHSADMPDQHKRAQGAAERIYALRTGHRIDPWTAVRGVVAHVYRSALNLRMGGELWSVVAQDVPDGPTTIRILDRDWSRAARAAVGASAVQRAGTLAVGGAVIDLRTAPAWSPEPFPSRPAEGALGRAGRLAATALAAGAAPWIPASLLTAMTDPRRGVPAMVGRGIGLTPAGDDALIGALAAAAALGEPVPDFAGAVLAASGTTTELSASMLRQACARDFHRPLHETVSAVVAAGDSGPATARLLAIGATSGADAALGAAAALSLLLQRHRSEPCSPGPHDMAAA